MNKCFACDKKLGKNPYIVDTRDDQLVKIGSDCHKKVLEAGDKGYEYAKGFVKLYPLPKNWQQVYKHLL